MWAGEVGWVRVGDEFGGRGRGKGDEVGGGREIAVWEARDIRAVKFREEDSKIAAYASMMEGGQGGVLCVNTLPGKRKSKKILKMQFIHLPDYSYLTCLLQHSQSDLHFRPQSSNIPPPPPFSSPQCVFHHNASISFCHIFPLARSLAVFLPQIESM